MSGRGQDCLGVAPTGRREKRTLAVSRKRGNAHNKPQKDEKTTKDENQGSRARAETTQSHQNDGRQNEISWEQRPHPESDEFI